MIFLDAQSQNEIKSKFVNNLPWNSFGRKNIGYLYAMANGADFIYDFDDDNALKFWIFGALNDTNLEIDTFVSDKLGKKHNSFKN